MLLYRIHRRAERTREWIRGWIFAYIVLPVHTLLGIRVRNLNRFERRVPLIERKEYSQNGEDGIIHALFAVIGTTNKYFVEFGCEDGVECNARYLYKHRGWKGLLMDGGHENKAINLHKTFITAENIEELFAQYDVPKDFDMLSIDIDGNDYWVWKAIDNYSPRIVIMEYNACIPYAPTVTIPYKADFSWDKTDYYGASLSAMVHLGKQKGYTLVCTDSCGVNAFFVRNDCLRGIHLKEPENLYHPAAFKGKKGNTHPKDTRNRPWVDVR